MAQEFWSVKATVQRAATDEARTQRRDAAVRRDRAAQQAGRGRRRI